MKELAVVFSATSTNGRWGLDVTAPEGTELPLAIMRVLGIVPGESAPEIPALPGGLADALESVGF